MNLAIWITRASHPEPQLSSHASPRFIVSLAICLSVLGASTFLAQDARSKEAANTQTDKLHTPKKDSEEEKDIVKAVIAKNPATSDVYHAYYTISFDPGYLLIHNGWAWTRGTLVGKEPGLGTLRRTLWEGLLHRETDKWMVMDLPFTDADHKKGPLFDRSHKEGSIQKIKETYPSVPIDIFPAS